MMKSKYILFPTLLSVALLLSACGESDSGSASAPASAPETTAAAPAAETSSDSSSSMGNIEKAEGVIYQDEIYANWPYN